jgi:hypothetical protein
MCHRFSCIFPGPPVSSTNKTDSRYNWNIVKNGVKHLKTNLHMIGVIQVYVHIQILHNYENEVTYDVYKMYNIWYGIIL